MNKGVEKEKCVARKTDIFVIIEQGQELQEIDQKCRLALDYQGP